VGSGQIDVIALQVVTVGQAASEKFEALQGADQYSEAYFFHGLAVQAAERPNVLLIITDDQVQHFLTELPQILNTAQRTQETMTWPSGIFCATTT